MVAVLRQRNFSLLWFGGVLSVTGDLFLFIALPFFVYVRFLSWYLEAQDVVSTNPSSKLDRAFAITLDPAGQDPCSAGRLPDEHSDERLDLLVAGPYLLFLGHGLSFM